MKGRGSTKPGTANDKWFRINQLIRTKKIAILAVQETHLDSNYVDDLHNLFDKRIKICHSEPLDRPTASQGVAFVINKEKIEVDKVTATNIIPGRAIMLDLTWHKIVKLKILNVYAPNDHAENEIFWQCLKTKWQATNMRKPDILLGDFNLVEGALDRKPQRTDPKSPVESLQNLYTYFNLSDSWRDTFPDRKLYTYCQENGGSMSRIDRIYLNTRLAENALEWTINPPEGIPTDHQMITTTLQDKKLPYVGQGRWVIPQAILSDKKFIKFITSKGRELTEIIDEMVENKDRTELNNPQTLWQIHFKEMITEEARRLAKVNIPKMQHRLDQMKKSRESILNTNYENEVEESNAHWEAALLLDDIKRLEAKRFNGARSSVAVNDWLHGEKISKYWISTNKPKTPRDIILTLRDPKSGYPEGHPNHDPESQPTYLTRSDQMADAAADFYNDLQKDENPSDPALREEEIQEALRHTEKTFSQRAKEDLDSTIGWWDVSNALKTCGCGRAPGIDGIPYELWKHLQALYAIEQKSNKQAKKKGKRTKDEALDIVGLLMRIFQDIQKHGLTPNSTFTEGWIIPLYKKNDKREITNYRPITLLNSDFKLLDKINALRLAKWAHQIINPAQAGFIPKRSIFDQTNLARIMTDYAEAFEENGIIVTLDQEKAYDRVAHDYIWKALEQHETPSKAIDLIRTLYGNAESRVMINGVFSKPFKITRGVRQGDPLSCLLFDIAIEPLACMLRQSNLKGFNITGLTERIIAMFFADDTTVYLSENDSFADLLKILRQWCKAAKAKFNQEKTKVIPIGSPKYRLKVVIERSFNINNEKIPLEIEIASDGTLTRLLGAWIGNDADEMAPWATVIQRIRGRLNEWEKPGLTIFGRRLIANMEVGGRMQYLTKVQGISPSIQDELTKIVKNFIWPNQHAPPVNMETLYSPIKEGGLGLIDIKSRAKAIHLTWLKPFLNLSKTRPAWAYAADALIAKAAKASGPSLDEKTKLQFFLQKWEINASPSSPLPKYLRVILNLAKEFNATFSAIKISRKLKKRMPIWLHIGESEEQSTTINKRINKCLRNKHCIRTIEQLSTFVEYGDRTISRIQKHYPKRTCCQYCAKIRELHGCENPKECYETAKATYTSLPAKWTLEREPYRDNLSLTTNRKKANIASKGENEELTFDPSITVKKDLSRCFRIFANPHKKCNDTANRQITKEISRETTIVYTDGSCLNNGSQNSIAGAGIWYGKDDRRNIAIRVQDKLQSNNTGELSAILYVLQSTPKILPLRIMSDSSYAINGIIWNSRKWEERGWIDVENKDLFKSILSWNRARGAITEYKWIKGHSEEEGPNKEGNDAADELARQGTELPQSRGHVHTTLEEYLPTGAQISKTTQKILYKGIRSSKPVEPRRKTTTNLKIIQEDIYKITSLKPTEERIWKAIRNRTNSRKIQIFLWKMIHDAFRCGNWWLNLKNYEDRARCQICNEEDSMEHILLKCNAPGQRVIWNLVKDTFERKTNIRLEISKGLIMGANLLTFKDKNDKKLEGTSRLATILLTESAFVIWKLRCERVIVDEDEPPKIIPENVVLNKWYNAINTRLKTDIALTNKRFPKHKQVKDDLVLKTWSGTLDREDLLPENWISWTGVLVGRLTKEPSPEPEPPPSQAGPGRM